MSAKIEKANVLRRKRVQNFRDRQNSNKVLKRSNSDGEINNHSSLGDIEDLENHHDDLNLGQAGLHTNLTDDNQSSDSLFNLEEYFSDESEGSDCASSDEESEKCKVDDIIGVSLLFMELRKWAFANKITHSSLQLLLLILKPYHPELPLSPKTLLKSKTKLCNLIKKFNPEDTDSAELFYFGIARNLQRIINVALHVNKIIRLQFNIDGLPLFKSSSLEFWPILCKVFSAIEKYTYKPFIISIYSGLGKPKSVEKFLADFIEEINHLFKNGIYIQGQHFAIEVMCFCCDRPARSFIKCIKGHGGYYACERCDVEGEDFKDRIIYPATGEKRSNDTFRSQKNPDHHNAVSPLIYITPPIDMVFQFVLDIMHLIFLGVVKKLLVECWLATASLRQNMLRLSARLVNLSKQVPCEFQRTTRSLAEVCKWKATEFRFFLLYSGPFVLKGILPEVVYKHFLLLSVALRILCSADLCQKYMNHAERYLKRFVELTPKLYGKEALVMNVHSLIHIVDDVKKMGCPLSDLTAFCFENKLGLIKKFVKHGKKPLVQVVKRIEEELELDDDTIQISEIKVMKSNKSKTGVTIQRLQLHDAVLSNKNPDNVVFLNNNTIVQIEKMDSTINNPSEKDINFHGNILKIMQPALSYPSSSDVLDMYQVKVPNEKEKPEKISFSVGDIKSKMVLLKIYEFDTDIQEWFVVPLLHKL